MVFFFKINTDLTKSIVLIYYNILTKMYTYLPPICLMGAIRSQSDSKALNNFHVRNMVYECSVFSYANFNIL